MVLDSRASQNPKPLVKVLIRIAGFVMVLLMLVDISGLISFAQQPVVWSRQQRILGYADQTLTPILVADENRTVHAFVSQWVGERDPQVAIFYNQWNPEQGWTTPIDILLSPIGQARISGAFLDRTGIMHIIFFGGDDQRADMYYSAAPAVNADRALAWSTPILIGERAITPNEAALAGDEGDNLFVLYSGESDGRGIYFLHSADAGLTWSDPIPIFYTYSQELWPTALQIFLDTNNKLHAVWSVGNVAGNGESVYYAALETGQLEWSEPIELAQAIGFEADTPAVFVYEDELFVIYHNDFPTTRWMRRSSDGGRTWTEPVRLFPHVGSNGAASMVVDSNNVLHMFFGNRVGEPAVHGMWHSIWQDGRWNGPDVIVSGPQIQDEVGGNGFDPSFANAVVSQGNVILVTWRSDPQAGLNGVWYSHTTLDAPELPVVPLPVPSVVATATAIPLPTETPSTPVTPPSPSRNKPEVVAYQNDSPAVVGSSPTAPLLIGIVPTLFLIVIVIIAVRQMYHIGHH